MHISAVMGLVVVLAGSAGIRDSHAQARRRRPPIYYDEQVQWHHHDPGVQLPEPEEPSRRRLPEGSDREETATRSRWRGEDLSFTGSALYVPPLPAMRSTSQEERRRNWLVLSIEESTDTRLHGTASEEDEENEPVTGWGWLADAVESRRREREEQDGRSLGREEAEAEAEWFLQRRSGFGGLMDTAEGVGPVRLGVDEDTEEDSRRRDRDERQTSDRWTSAREPAIRDNRPVTAQADARDDSRSTVPERSSWQEESAMAQSAQIRSALSSPFGDHDARTEDAESRFSPWRSDQNGWSRVGSGTDVSRNEAEIARSISRLPDSGTDRSRDRLADHRFSTDSGISSAVTAPSFDRGFSAPSDAGWNAGWSGDSGWQSRWGVNESSSPPAASSPSPGLSSGISPSLTHGAPHQRNAGWLSTPPP